MCEITSDITGIPNNPSSFKFYLMPIEKYVLDMDFASLYSHRQIVGMNYVSGKLNFLYYDEKVNEETKYTLNLDNL